MSKQVCNAFERGFLSESLLKQIEDCERYELSPLFLDLFRFNQPVLEAGCGSGRWCGWFLKHGIQSDGIDLSNALCSRAQKELSCCKFIVSDIQEMGFTDCSYNGLIALGSIEHQIYGPAKVLKEFNRVLRDRAKAVITVPYGGSLRRTLTFLGLRHPISSLKKNKFLRLLIGKALSGKTLREVRLGTVAVWNPRFSFGENGWYFYEYEFNKSQMRTFLYQAGFEIKEEFIAFGNEGIFHNFGKISGKWNPTRADIDFTLLGRILRRVIPVSIMGHMLCYVVQKTPNII